MIYGYSERGIFNSIIYYLDYKRPDLIGEFLNKILELEKDVFSSTSHSFIFLNEQSFSDFGDSDLTIIAKPRSSKGKKAVVFIEGKVKTFDGKYNLEKECENVIKTIKGESDFEGSNIFIQLYYKYLLQTVVNSKEDIKLEEKDTSTAGLKINSIFKRKYKNPERRIGDNGIVHKACEMIKGAGENYFYVAILPVDVKSENLKEKYDAFNKALSNESENMNTENVRCVYWGEIEDFFEDAESVIGNFNYNKCKDKKDEYNSQIYNK